MDRNEENKLTKCTRSLDRLSKYTHQLIGHEIQHDSIQTENTLDCKNPLLMHHASD